MRRGDICIAASAGEFGKPRPVVIVQANASLIGLTMTYVPITSERWQLPEVRVGISPSPENGLRKESELMVDRIQTATLARFGPKIGHLDRETMQKVEAALMIHLGLI